MGKGEIARKEQFFLFPQCFIPTWRLLSAMIKREIVISKLFEFGSLKFVVWERVNKETLWSSLLTLGCICKAFCKQRQFTPFSMFNLEV